MDLALLTDLYQLTMAQAYWVHGMASHPSVFNLYYRRAPFGGQAALVAGIAPAVDYLEGLRFTAEHLDYLGGIPAPAGGRVFRDDFLRWLGSSRPALHVHAAMEGEVVLPGAPIIRVEGNLLWAQLVETTLLNLVNFQTLVATKAARVCTAAAGRTVLEFGLRRAQGPDGAMSATRAAWVGGVSATSNVLAAKELGIPVRGTHAHAWVMAHENERDAFARWAEATPGNALFLVDTWDTRQGVQNAVEVALAMKARGQRCLGVRLDSGKLGELAREARAALDAAGLLEMKVLASSDLDEHAIAALVAEGAPVDSFGVGTRLVTGHDQPALGGVYKLGALDEGKGWRRCAKRSEDRAKVAVGGCLQARRGDEGDVIYCTWDGGPGVEGRDLLVPVLRDGRRVEADLSLAAARARGLAAVERGHFHPVKPVPLRPARWSAPMAARIERVAAGGQA